MHCRKGRFYKRVTMENEMTRSHRCLVGGQEPPPQNRKLEKRWLKENIFAKSGARKFGIVSRHLGSLLSLIKVMGRRARSAREERRRFSRRANGRPGVSRTAATGTLNARDATQIRLSTMPPRLSSSFPSPRTRAARPARGAETRSERRFRS